MPEQGGHIIDFLVNKLLPFMGETAAPKTYDLLRRQFADDPNLERYLFQMLGNEVER